MMLLAKGLLTDYAEHFGELPPVGTVTFVAGQAVETVIERLFARQIVQVIGIPDEVLGAPIGLSNTVAAAD